MNNNNNSPRRRHRVLRARRPVVTPRNNDEDSDDATDPDMPPLLDENDNANPNRFGALEDDDDSELDDMPPLMDPNNNGALIREIESDEEEDEDEDEEDYSEDDDDDYSDDEDDDDDEYDPSDDFDMFMRMMLRGELTGDASDEEDDEDYCDCPRCSMRRLVLRMGAGGGGNDTSRDAVADESLDETLTEGSIDPNSPTCAVCLEHESTRRQLVCLPCCGADAEVERASSTRFCEKCLHKCLRTNRAVRRNGCSINECPRCKRLLAVANGGEVRNATPPQLFYYILEQPQRYHMYLMVAAWCHADYLPAELLDLKQNEAVSQECTSRLLQWGFLQKCESSKNSNSNNDVYRMDPQLQTDLRDYCATFLKANLEGDIVARGAPVAVDNNNNKNNMTPQYLMTAIHGLTSAWECCKKFKARRTLRLLNRTVLLFCCAGKIFPGPAEWNHPRAFGHVATALNLFFSYLVIKILLQALWIVVYVGTGLGAAVLTGWWMKAPPPKTWMRYARNIGTGAVVVGAGLYFGKMNLSAVWNVAKGAFGWGWASSSSRASPSGGEEF